MELGNMNELQRMADYFALTKNVRRRWRTNIILGVLGVVYGFLASILWSPVNLILIIIGIFLVIVGIRARIVSKLNSLLFSGIALCVVAVWTLVVSTINYAVSLAYYWGSYGGAFALSIMWGCFYLVWGADALVRYRRYSAVSSLKPSDEMLQRVENIIKPILDADVGREHDIIEFKTAGTWSTNSWKAKLNEAYVILVSKGGCDISFVRPEEFEITEQGRAGLTQYRKASVRIKGSKLRSSISPLSLQRYGLWRNMVSRFQQSTTHHSL